ncbi:MAG: DUF4293 domain-containing protein [Muribaculaceae bacterium]|nr:DUF4293 domain-containing protein [Muribaculaceae bacterium]
MVIQRIQTLMLLIAAVLMAVFCLTPYGVAAGEPSTPIFVKEAPVLLTLNIVVSVLLLIIIFMYHNLKQQMRMTLLAVALICVTGVTSLFILGHAYDNASPVLLGGVGLLVLAVIFTLLAYRGMKHDHKLLRSADRLR